MLRIKVYLDNCAYNRPFDDQPFDYTEWSREYFADYDPDKFLKDAVEYDKNNPL